MSFQNELEDAVNPFGARMQTRQKEIKTNKTRIQKMLESGEKSARLLPIEQIKDSADQFQRRNPELKSSVLVLLRQYIKPGDSAEEILKKIQEFYSDVSLADEALEFLLETSDGELAKQVQEAKDSSISRMRAKSLPAETLACKRGPPPKKGWAHLLPFAIFIEILPAILATSTRYSMSWHVNMLSKT